MRLERRPTRNFARRVHHEAYRDVVERQFGAWDLAAQDAYFRAGWDAAPHEIIELDGVPVGYVCVEDRPGLVHVRELVVLPEFQNRGIGTAILQQVLAYAAGRGLPVQLGTLHANRAAALYVEQVFAKSDAPRRTFCSSGRLLPVQAECDSRVALVWSMRGR
ncbi:MAG: GNAT family N-acetyltransferase [Chloroflexi bacterium]|nr:GNAT family N-acetyltransferase [Chloroflexota bacterium]